MKNEEKKTAQIVRHAIISNNAAPMARRDFFRVIGTHIAAFTVFAFAVDDVSAATALSGTPTDALLEEYGTQLLTENGEYLLI